MEQQYSTIEEALEELRAGRIIITIDDPDRENEGDMICAAQFATTENVNFMATHAKGLICTPMSAELAARLGLEQMVKINTDNHSTSILPCLSTMWTLPPVSLPRNGATPAANVPIPPPGRKTCAVPGMYFLWWPGRAAC